MNIQNKQTCARQLLLLVSIFLSATFSLQAQRITGVYTTFNYNGTGYWHGTGPSTDVANQPGDSHDVLAFTWKGTTYTTGVNDAIIDAITPAVTPISKQNYRSLPVNSLPAAGANTYVGVGVDYNINTANNSMEYYLTDGERGLNLGTGVYNLPGGGISKYTLEINATSFDMPAMAITQIGDYNTDNNDEFYFVNAAGQVVGNKRIVDFDTVAAVGTGRFKFYSVTPSGLTFSASTGANPLRAIRMVAFSLAEFGITAANMGTVTQLWHRLSGNSDQAFIGAYNTAAMKVYQSVSGFVYTGGASAPGSPGYQDAVVTLYDSNNNLVATATTNPAGYYVFNDVAPGNYTIRITKPNGTSIVGSSDSGTDTDLAVTVNEEPVTNTYFSLNSSLPVHFGAISAAIRDGQLRVNWSTLSEVNNKYFEVEASADGENFKTIGSVDSKAINGSSDIALEYSFGASLPQLPLALGASVFLLAGLMGVSRKRRLIAGSAFVLCLGMWVASCTKKDATEVHADTTVFVRIKQVDKDGSFTYSKPVKAQVY
ncbi:SdrD B-like domain-containing protein [Niabella sp. 22666]|uniref:SdrD B-like domain-containing protein n=1 Tax=Niabella sp. 22666 TaxID=3453954 RepID=UPI003F837D86